MTNIILPNTAKNGNGLSNHINATFSIASRQAGDDIVISKNDAAKAFSRQNFLSLEAQIPLKEGTEAAVAKKLYSQLSEIMKQHQPPPPDKGNINVPGGFGILTEIDAASVLLTVQPNIHVEKTLAQHVIPLMLKELKAEFVTGVTVDVHKLQTYLSVEKIALLTSLYGVDTAKTLVQEKDALNGVLPFATDALGYVDALTRFSPMSFTLPFHRANCSWHFQGKGMWGFPGAASNAFSSRFILAPDPLAEQQSMLGLHGLKGMSETNIWRYLRVLVNGINNLLSYLIDIRNFADSSGKVDFLRQIQSHSAVHLLFADIAAMNFSTEAHQRITFAFSALDKLANLRVSLGDNSPTEASAMRALCSASQCQELLKVYAPQFQQFNAEDALKSFTDVTTHCYSELHSHLEKQGATNESARLERIGYYRDIRQHGTFLRKEKFEKLFLESGGTVPDTIASLPFLLTLGLISNPERFLKFHPTV